MESTGVYWRPVWTVLEGGFDLLLVNARHVKHVPGRKTDVKDSEWIAQLLECGLLKGSFVPPPPIRDLRDLTRLRKFVGPRQEQTGQPGGEGSGTGQRQARLGRLGHHGQDRAGDPGRHDRCRARSASVGRAGPWHTPPQAGSARRRGARADSGPPQVPASAASRTDRRVVEADRGSRRPHREAAARVRGSYYRALYFRHKARGGPKRAIVVVQHAILVAIWHMLSHGTLHEDLGSDHFRERDRDRTKRHLLQRLRKIGRSVSRWRSSSPPPDTTTQPRCFTETPVRAWAYRLRLLGVGFTGGAIGEQRIGISS